MASSNLLDTNQQKVMLQDDVKHARQKEQILQAKLQKYERDIDLIKFESKTEHQKNLNKLSAEHANLQAELQ